MLSVDDVVSRNRIQKNAHEGKANCHQRSSELYETLYLIRRVEEELLRLFGEGKLFGTTHGSIGQQGCSVLE